MQRCFEVIKMFESGPVTCRMISEPNREQRIAELREQSQGMLKEA